MGLDPSKPIQQSIGRYDILEMIAEGGMGTVYKGRNRETGEIVAIKIVPPNAAKNPTLLKCRQSDRVRRHVPDSISRHGICGR